MKTASRLGFVLIGLLVGIVAAQALPALADGVQGSIMRHGHMHGMGHYHGHHMNGMHGMMHEDGACPMGDVSRMPEACQRMVDDRQAHLEECGAYTMEGMNVADIESA